MHYLAISMAKMACLGLCYRIIIILLMPSECKTKQDHEHVVLHEPPGVVITLFN